MKLLHLAACLRLAVCVGLLTASGSARAAAAEQIQVNFAGSPTDGVAPQANLLMDGAGNLYGTTAGGPGVPGNGTVFELVNNGGSYSLSVLYDFAGGIDGATPKGALARDSAGNLFGVTIQGGASNDGTVFELVDNGGSFTERVLYSFTGGADGLAPWYGPVLDSFGNIYGTTTGSNGGPGPGSVYELARSGANYTETTLYGFSAPGDGRIPQGGLLVDPTGNIFGTTEFGGANGDGTVYELTNAAPDQVPALGPSAGTALAALLAAAGLRRARCRKL